MKKTVRDMDVKGKACPRQMRFQRTDAGGKDYR